MRVRGVLLGLTVIVATTVLHGAAEAGEQRKMRRIAPPPDNYYSGPGFVHRIPGLRVFFGDYALSQEEYDKLYGEDDQFDESYYEPQPLVTAKPKLRPAAKSAKAASRPAAAAPLTTASVNKSAIAQPVTKKPAAKASLAPAAKSTAPSLASSDEAPEKAATPAAAPVKQASATGGLTCDKATSIVTGYGFSAVKPDSCTGKVYAFNATRDGRSFAIKVDAANGELTEVKKLN